MGLFSGTAKAKEPASRQNDSPGNYWQRIDKITLPEIFKTKAKYLKIYKTNIRAFPGAELAAGTEPGHAIFQGLYFATEVKAFLRGVLGSEDYEQFKEDLATRMEAARSKVKPTEADEAASAAEDAYVNEVLTSGVLHGRVVEAQVYTRPGKALKDGSAGKPFTVVDYRRPVENDEILEHLDEATRKRFGLLQETKAAA